MQQEGTEVAAPALAPADNAADGAPQGKHGESHETSRDVGTALRNGIKLGSSLLATWSVALLLRLLLPRFLGPGLFGTVNFSDNFSATYFALLGLGVDTYAQRELPVRPKHASDFFGGLFALRLVLSFLLLGALALTLFLTHRSQEVQRLVFLFGCGQMLVTANVTLACMVQAGTAVGGLAMANVGGKLLWGAGVLASLFLHLPLEALAVAVIISEAIKATILFRIVRVQYDLKIRFDFKALKQVLITSVPFYVNGVVIALCAKLDITMLEFLTGDSKQVGWYSASSNVASLVMLMSPLLGWVVMPLMSRAAARSEEELFWVVRRAIAGIYVVTMPIILMCVLGADVWIKLLFGAAYAPAAMSLRAQAPLFMLTYMAMLLSMTLIVLKRPWKLTMVSTVGVIVNPLFISLCVPLAQRVFGEGGGGVGAALGVVGMESVVTTLLLHDLGRRAIDRRVVSVVGKSFACMAVVGCVHVFLHGIGFWRLGVDLLLYIGLALGVGIVTISEIRTVIGSAVNKRAASAAA